MTWRALAMALLLWPLALQAAPAPATRSGGEVMARFHAQRATTGCADASRRWQLHYAHAATRLAQDKGIALPLFGYVLDAVHDAGLPSEFALIPFVESRYRANARSPGGQTGLWQFTAATARRHGLRVNATVDERMSVVGSTRAAVDYLKRLHRMFGRDWRQAAMAYNAGEGALKASRRKDGKPLSGIARSYPHKLHAIACLFDERRGRPQWQRAIQRPIPRLAARQVPPATRDVRQWASTQGLDPALVAALNPGWHRGTRQVLAPVARAPGAGREPRGEAN